MLEVTESEAVALTETEGVGVILIVGVMDTDRADHIDALGVIEGVTLVTDGEGEGNGQIKSQSVLNGVPLVHILADYVPPTRRAQCPVSKGELNVFHVHPP